MSAAIVYTTVAYLAARLEKRRWARWLTYTAAFDAHRRMISSAASTSACTTRQTSSQEVDRTGVGGVLHGDAGGDPEVRELVVTRQFFEDEKPAPASGSVAFVALLTSDKTPRPVSTKIWVSSSTRRERGGRSRGDGRCAMRDIVDRRPHHTRRISPTSIREIATDGATSPARHCTRIARTAPLNAIGEAFDGFGFQTGPTGHVRVNGRCELDTVLGTTCATRRGTQHYILTRRITWLQENHGPPTNTERPRPSAWRSAMRRRKKGTLKSGRSGRR